MKPIDRSEILGLADYETIRPSFRARVIAEKRHRRVALGSKVTVLFENRDTVLLQIQEMLRTERITRPQAVQHEVDTYNELVPGGDELSATLMIEIADPTERDAFLAAARGIEDHVWIVAQGQRIRAQESDRLHGAPAERTTTLHYLKFPLPRTVAEALRSSAAARSATLSVDLEVDHPAYRVRVGLLPSTLVVLGEDLQA